jgi:hypothetical protein
MQDKIINYLYSGLTIVLVFDLWLIINYSMSIAGYWFETAAMWLWILLTIYLISRNWETELAKAFALLLTILIILSMIPMMIPFLGIINILTLNDRSFTKDLDNGMRIQIRNGPMFASIIEIVEQGYILEKKIVSISAEIRDIEKAKFIKVVQNTQDSLKIAFVFSDKTIEETFAKNR